MKVLVIDDSVVFRTAIKSALLSSGEVKDVRVANNGQIALQYLKNDSFDAITIDLEMPVMDGIETIKEVRKNNKEIPIIIFSAQNLNAASKTLKALEMGANDFVQKVEGDGNINSSLEMIEKELVPKFKALLERKNKKTSDLLRSNQTVDSSYSAAISKDYLSGPKPGIIVIGSSTGGPDALKYIFKRLNKGIKTPILLVQHMPPVFSKQLAITLNDFTDLKVEEAQEGALVLPGHCYLAPGDFHMRVFKNEQNQLYLGLDQSEKVCFVRPSIDVTIDTLIDNYSGLIGSFILTGMGTDGHNSTKRVRIKGGFVVIQDEASSVVWGMPKAIYDSKHFNDMLSLEEIPEIINKVAKY